MLQIVDAQWKDHLYSLDHLKEGIGLRGYGQRDPLVEYKKESFALFQAMKDRVEEEIVRYLWRLHAGARRRCRRRAARRCVRRSRGVRRTARRCSSPQSAPPPSPFGALRRNAAGRRGTPAPARTGGDDVRQAGEARRAEGRTQRPVPVRQREEIQEVPWRMRSAAAMHRRVRD